MNAGQEIFSWPSSNKGVAEVVPYIASPHAPADKKRKVMPGLVTSSNHMYSFTRRRGCSLLHRSFTHQFRPTTHTAKGYGSVRFLFLIHMCMLMPAYKLSAWRVLR